ncbi:PREDICTED: RCC1 domain-containing protein 1 isoform X3 [Calidris pugnax]|uniref:RCC1 domain-containing protein 1 isoform X3 n=1 Tax=Calidris pugnax TaxID=198806 RepID=UPI00071D4F3A|nr:PREDICTED: RCC1 domain-containing protein 1 isoform X3 [Calidris pugnax]
MALCPHCTPPPLGHGSRRGLVERQSAMGCGRCLSVCPCVSSCRHGQLGHGTLESEPQPRLVEALAGVPMQAVAAGGWHSASVSGDAELRSPQEQPVAEDAAFISIQAFPALLDLPQELEVTQVSCGSRHTAVITRGGELFTWGWGAVASAGSRLEPAIPWCSHLSWHPKPGTTVVSAGKYGQLGHGDKASSDRPRRVQHLVAEGLRAEEVVCGPWTTYVCVLEP